MKSVRFIGILIILLLTIGSASADVVLTKEVEITKATYLSVLPMMLIITQ